MSRPPAPRPDPAARPRETRLAAALRDNLRRRKAAPSPTHPADTPDVDLEAEPAPRR